jgi:hypothetical protein
METATEQCPWCGSPVSRVKFQEIRERIQEEERKRLSELEDSLRTKIKSEKEAFEAKLKSDFDKRAAKVAADHDKSLREIQQLKKREADLHKQVDAEVERKVKDRLGATEKERQEELRKQRQSLEKDRDLALLKKEAELNRQREGWQNKLKMMERQLQQKTANEIGDGAEIDLYECLRESFPGDRVKRVQKGQAGADINFEVVHKGEVCGRILIDSKNRQAWQNGFTSKLRQDQVEAKAEHAILATPVFPSGKKELCVSDGIILVNPARAVYVVELLRAALVRMHCLGLSAKERTGKMARLYKYINSENYHQRFVEASRLTQDLLELDVEEQKEHQKTWKKRGLLVTRQKNVLRDIETEVSAILESSEQVELQTAV